MCLFLIEDTLREMYVFCQEALELYVVICEQSYREQFLSYNVHGPLHSKSDVEILENFEKCNAFPFENNIPELQKTVSL